MHDLMSSHPSPNWLIINMDAYQQMTSKHFMVHLPVHYQPKVGCHITVNEYIAKSGDAVEESFGLQKALGRLAENDNLKRVRVFVNGIHQWWDSQ